MSSVHIQDLARVHGIQPDWQDIWGTRHNVDDNICRSLLSAMNVSAGNASQIHQSMQAYQHATLARWLDYVMVVPETDGFLEIPINLPSPIAGRTYIWQFCKTFTTTYCYPITYEHPTYNFFIYFYFIK